MRVPLFLTTLLLILGIVTAQWDDDPCEDPQCPGDPEDDPPWQPTPTSEPDPDETATPDPPVPIPTGIDTFYNATIYQPDSATHHLTSPRTEYLPNNTVLAVWNDAASINDTLLVYRSSNNGFSWYSHGTAKSTIAGRTLLEPHVLFVENSWSGDVNITLLAVNAVDATSTNIELYASYDYGATFDFVHRIAEGGPVTLNTDGTAVGEPFMLYHDKRLTVYFSDQRDSRYAQKIVQQSTDDMWGSWGTTSDVATSVTPTVSLGALSAAKLPSGQYLLAVESSQNDTSYIQCKTTGTPENPGVASFIDIRTTTGLQPGGASYVTWSSLGGSNGTVVLSDSRSNSVFINQAVGAGLWREVSLKAGRAYGREVRSVPKDKTKLSIVTGSEGFSKSSDVLVSVIDLEKAIAAM
ncbi:hypothetical protein J1614_003714 [Plenodomus biglobosus]|nr:hypothetical protein J1614_003714 [Plenodomus biglobosus]